MWVVGGGRPRGRAGGGGSAPPPPNHSGEAREGLRAVIYGSVASAGLAIFTSTRVAAATITRFFAVGGNAGSGYDVAFSLALVGAGHLVGLSVGMAMLTGLLIAWVGAVSDEVVRATVARLLAEKS